MKQGYPSDFSPWEILIATFLHLLLAKSATPSVKGVCYTYTLGVSSDISHGRIKEAMDTNLLEVVGSSETAHTLVACDHFDSIRTTILRLLAYCCLNAIRERCQGFTQTTTKGDDYNYHKAKLWLRETHWQTILRSLAYTAISFLRTLYRYFRVFPCNVNRLDPVRNVPEYGNSCTQWCAICGCVFRIHSMYCPLFSPSSCYYKDCTAASHCC